jgi:metal-dependent amidase/aminoacylase/carboxypeptidase family protein
MISARLLIPAATFVMVASASAQTPPTLARIGDYVAAHASEFIAVRRDLHRHPETSGREVRTAGIVASRLIEQGLDVRTGVGGHGVVALLKGGRPGPLLAYRADMDAVPSRDPDPVDFPSETPGVRHQCGHDVHTAIGLALAAALGSVRADLPGSVLFIFQPAEESAVGAKAMLAAGVLGSQKPVAIYGLHTSPYEAGQIATRPGVLMAARDVVRVTATGTGDVAHAMAAARAVVAALSTLTAAQAFQPAPEGFSFVQMGAPTSSNGGLVLQAGITVAGVAARERVKQELAKGLTGIVVSRVVISHQYVDKFVAGVTNDAELTAATNLSTY